MKTPKRYLLDIRAAGLPTPTVEVVEHPDGLWVKWSDCMKLLEEAEALRKTPPPAENR